MIPSVLSSQIQKGVEDFLKTTFPVSTPFFHGVMARFLGEDGGIFKGPYLSIRLPYRTSTIGQEFDDVIIASVNEGIVPLQLPAMDDQSTGLAEENENLERALLYVSATRAKKKVLMTSYGVKSPFLMLSSTK